MCTERGLLIYTVELNYGHVLQKGRMFLVVGLYSGWIYVIAAHDFRLWLTSSWFFLESEIRVGEAFEGQTVIAYSSFQSVYGIVDSRPILQ